VSVPDGGVLASLSYDCITLASDVAVMGGDAVDLSDIDDEVWCFVACDGAFGVVGRGDYETVWFQSCDLVVVVYEGLHPGLHLLLARSGGDDA
jgi:hypothetical protein